MTILKNINRSKQLGINRFYFGILLNNVELNEQMRRQTCRTAQTHTTRKHVQHRDINESCCK